MVYYNQHDYAHVPYPRPSDPYATVKSGGCGVCCGSTVLSFFGEDIPPEKLAPIFIAMGARADAGTDMKKAADIICELGGLTYTTTSDESVLAGHLRSGGIAIANMDGDAGAPGIFSSGGHYIVVLEARDNGDFVVFDVGYYPGKYDSIYRKDKVKLEGELQVCSTATLHMDTLNRTPNYYLFREAEMTQAQFDKMMDAWLARQNARPEDAWSIQEGHFAKAKAMGVVSGAPKEVVRKDALIAILGRMELLK